MSEEQLACDSTDKWIWAPVLERAGEWAPDLTEALAAGLARHVRTNPVSAPIQWWTEASEVADRARKSPLDLSQGPIKNHNEWAWAPYDQRRPGQYTQSEFARFERVWHFGIDLVAPEKTPVMAVLEGQVFGLCDHSGPGDYGPTVIVESEIRVKNAQRPLWLLYGHLSRASLRRLSAGQRVRPGDWLGELGSEAENGGWPSHLHLQLSWLPPIGFDLPGVVREIDRRAAQSAFPDPLVILNQVLQKAGLERATAQGR